MAKDDFVYIDSGERYERITQIDGIRTTYCANRFEIIAATNGEIQEERVIQQLREWVRWRREKGLQPTGGMPE